MPSGSARVCITAMVCGWVSAWTQNTVRRCAAAPSAPRACSTHIIMASAAAVASSSSDALAIGSAVRSSTMVWKLSSASSRPCEISAWYGVYCVYQPGSSRTLRRITGGVIVS